MTKQIVLHTDGKGWYSNQARPVIITKMELSYDNDDGDFGELRVYFDTDSWNTEVHGLIYTDKQWIKELRAFLKNHSYKGVNDVNYSEQGMQGDDYVSLDVRKAFIDSWKLRNNEKLTRRKFPRRDLL